MAFKICSIKPSAGAEFVVEGIRSYGWRVTRHSNPSGYLGQNGHNLGEIVIERTRSLQKGGVAQMEDELVKLAAGIEKKAYFSGSITLRPAEDSALVIEKLQWDQGHITEFSRDVVGDEISERILIAVVELHANDSAFRRGLPT